VLGVVQVGTRVVCGVAVCRCRVPAVAHVVSDRGVVFAV